MKRQHKFLIPFLIINSAIITSCNLFNRKQDNDENKVLLSFGDVHATHTQEITISELNELVKTKESFLLVVSSDTCGCWSEFEPNLNSYISQNKIRCYRIHFNDIENSASAYGLFLLTKSSTTFAIFEEGRLKTSINSIDNKNILYDKDTFAKYMTDNVILPKCYFITKNDYHTIKNSGKNAVIYFERNACEDCKAINPGILKNYWKNHINSKIIYVLDCQEYWTYLPENPTEEQKALYKKYLDTKKELGMDDETNPLYGFGGGVFPFFSYIEGGEYASGCVVYNQRVNSDLQVYDSYFTNERVSNLAYTSTVLEGLQLTLDDVTSTASGKYRWKQEKADEKYGPILNEFLDWAIPKTTFTF